MKEIKVGIFVNTHGLKGEVKVKLTTDFASLRFAKNACVYMHTEGGVKQFSIHSTRPQKDMLLVKFKGYNHINEVESWKGNAFFIYEDQLQELEEDEAYYHELMDASVFDTNEQELGKVIEIIETGANIVLRVEMHGKQMLIPFVKAFVKSFDKQEKTMIVEVMEGL